MHHRDDKQRFYVIIEASFNCIYAVPLHVRRLQNYLHVRRMQTMASEMFKIVNKLSPKYIQDAVNIKVSNYNFRNERAAEVPRVRTTRYGFNTFLYMEQSPKSNKTGRFLLSVLSNILSMT